jgi:hypothetical protein
MKLIEAGPGGFFFACKTGRLAGLFAWVKDGPPIPSVRDFNTLGLNWSWPQKCTEGGQAAGRRLRCI